MIHVPSPFVIRFSGSSFPCSLAMIEDGSQRLLKDITSGMLR
jgi:hypothetical protein